MAKKVQKIEVAEKSDLKYWVISSVNLDLWYMVLEAKKEHIITQKMANLLKNTIFFTEWSLEIKKID